MDCVEWWSTGRFGLITVVCRRGSAVRRIVRVKSHHAEERRPSGLESAEPVNGLGDDALSLWAGPNRRQLWVRKGGLVTVIEVGLRSGNVEQEKIAEMRLGALVDTRM